MKIIFDFIFRSHSSRIGCCRNGNRQQKKDENIDWNDLKLEINWKIRQCQRHWRKLFEKKTSFSTQFSISMSKLLKIGQKKNLHVDSVKEFQYPGSVVDEKWKKKLNFHQLPEWVALLKFSWKSFKVQKSHFQCLQYPPHGANEWHAHVRHFRARVTGKIYDRLLSQYSGA